MMIAAAVMAFSLLGRGCGCDGDFPRHLGNGVTYLLEGRVPGNWPPFPIMDLLHGSLAILAGYPGPWWQPILNCFSFLCSICSFFLFRAILKNYQQEGLEGSLFPVVALMVVHPIYVVASGVTGDYMVSLTLLLSAWLSVLKKDFTVGSVLMGLAVGTRISNCLWILPLSILAKRRDGTRAALGFAFSSAVVGGLAIFPSLAKIGFKIGMNSGGRGSEAQSLLGTFKSSLSKILGFVGLPTLLITLAVCRKPSYKKSLAIIKRYPELVGVLLLELAVFCYLPSDPGYIISTLPIIAILLPKPDKRSWICAQVVSVFAMNVVVFDFQNKIPTKFHLSHGYFTGEFTCHATDTVLEPLRFSVPRRPDGGYYSPISDWTADARPKNRR